MWDAMQGASEPVLVVLAHPALERSRANARLARVAESVPGVTLLDLYETYPDFLIDIAAEQRLLQRHGALVLQFPVQWYGMPALLKEWLDTVWLHGFAYGSEARALRGKVLLGAITTGGEAAEYGPDGTHRFPIGEFLRPLEQTAHLCGMRWAEPFLVHGTPLLDEAGLDAAAAHYRDRLAALAAGETE